MHLYCKNLLCCRIYRLLDLEEHFLGDMISACLLTSAFAGGWSWAQKIKLFSLTHHFLAQKLTLKKTSRTDPAPKVPLWLCNKHMIVWMKYPIVMKQVGMCVFFVEALKCFFPIWCPKTLLNLWEIIDVLLKAELCALLLLFHWFAEYSQDVCNRSVLLSIYFIFPLSRCNM